MTISSTLSRWEYLGDNLTTEFTYNNKIFVNTEIEVYSDSILQTLTTDYTVSGVGLSTGGTVTYVTAPASNVSVVIIRVVPDTQSTEYPTGGSLPSSIIEDDLDRRTIISQQQQDALDRSIAAPAGETQVDMTLPVIATRASKYLGFDSNGSPVELDAPTGTTALSTFGAALGVAANSTAAQDLLNLSTSVTTAGSSTVYTSTSAEPITSYVDGQVFGVDFHVTCGAAPTLSRDGLAAKALVWPDGTALVAGDITTGGKALVSYDGTSFQVLSTPKTLGTAASVNTGVADGNVPAMDATGYPAADGSQITALAWANITGKPISIETFTASGTSTKPAGATMAFVKLTGAGGGGGRSTVNGGGGGGGGYNEHFFAAVDLTATIAVGIDAGGAGNSAGNGTDGGDTTYGAYLTAPGGKGGLGAGAQGGDGGNRASFDTGSTAYDGGAGGDSAVGGNSGDGGGGGGGSVSVGDQVGGKSMRGGGGGSYGSSDIAGGISDLAGNGGSAFNVTPAAAPGGGGGCRYNTTGYAGERGEATVYWF